MIKNILTGIANGEEIGIAYDLADGIVNGIVIGKADWKANTIATWIVKAGKDDSKVFCTANSIFNGNAGLQHTLPTQ